MKPNSGWDIAKVYSDSKISFSLLGDLIERFIIPIYVKLEAQKADEIRIAGYP